MIVEVTNLSKKYRGGKLGLNDFSITIEKGILGLLGPNGAGKSTLLKLLATISTPSTGSIFLNKNDIVKDPNYMRKQLGYLPQDFGVYPNLNANEFLTYIAALKGIGGPQLKQRISLLLHGLNLAEVAQKPIGSYSGGMKQRIGIAQALLNSPKVVLFDEPTVGLDPEERVRFRNLISELATESIVILSSHIVSDIVNTADQVAIMKEGRLITMGYQNQITEQLSGKVFESQIEAAQLDDFKSKFKVISHLRNSAGFQVRYISERLESTADDYNSNHPPNKRPCSGIACTASLEDAYLYLTKSN